MLNVVVQTVVYAEFVILSVFMEHVDMPGVLVPAKAIFEKPKVSKHPKN
jgi:hypothetical protein